MFVVLWEFRVKGEREREFDEAYAPGGEWARLFRRGKGYLATELWADPGVPRRYVTLDRWNSREEYEEFRREQRSDFEALDKRCEALMEREVHLGSFEVRGSRSGS
jgi:heme-degrading monooxygenase HmoA